MFHLLFLEVTVVNADEFPPQFLAGSGLVRVPEDFPPGLAVLVLRATDADLPDRVRYALTDTDTGLPFVLLSDSGHVLLAAPLDREAEDVYHLHFQALSGQGGAANLSVEVQ